MKTEETALELEFVLQKLRTAKDHMEAAKSILEVEYTALTKKERESLQYLIDVLRHLEKLKLASLANLQNQNEDQS